jgi:hypothetical protein
MVLALGADDVSDANADDKKSVAKLQLNIVLAPVNFPYPEPRGTLLLFMGMAGYLRQRLMPALSVRDDVWKSKKRVHREGYCCFPLWP